MRAHVATNLKSVSISEASGNKIANCTFFGGEADPLLEVQGAGMVFEDVRLIHVACCRA